MDNFVIPSVSKDKRMALSCRYSLLWDTYDEQITAV